MKYKRDQRSTTKSLKEYSYRNREEQLWNEVCEISIERRTPTERNNFANNDLSKLSTLVRKQWKNLVLCSRKL